MLNLYICVFLTPFVVVIGMLFSVKVTHTFEIILPIQNNNSMRLFFLLTALLGTACLQAQTVRDALMFSENQPMINARSMGVGNALGALGADLSMINTNPAGIGVYRRVELGLSMGMYNDATTTNFFGSNTRDRFRRVQFGNVGVVIPTRVYRPGSAWKFVNFGISLSHLTNYGHNFSFQGASTGSRVNAFAARAAGSNINQLDPYGEEMAYSAYLIGSVQQGNYIANGGITQNTVLYKSQTISRTGGVNELGVSFSGNYKNKLYLGATVGIDFLNYHEKRYYKETDQDNQIDFDNMSFQEDRQVDGTGINLKFGMIYRINRMFRVGLSVHTPTGYHLRESYISALTADIIYADTLRSTDFSITDGFKPRKLQHDLVTPWVVTGSVATIFGRRGFIGLDVEYLDFSAVSFDLGEEDRTPENNQFIAALNNDIERTYRGVFRARLGGELSLGIFRVRLGYRFQTSPYVVAVDGVTDMRHDISGGVGLRWKHFYLDAAYNHTISDFEYAPYSTKTNLQRVTGQSNAGRVMLTLGVVIFRDDN